MDRWINKVAIVTGASSGIGAAIAEELVNKGLKVVGLARRKERLEKLAESLEGKPGKLFPFRADITQEADIVEAFKWTLENVGPVSILVNNAGIGFPITLSEGKTEDFRKIFDTNVIGLCIATREALKIMKDNNIDGHIVNINSVLGHIIPQVPFLNVYPASKFAVTALTETLRQELTLLKSKVKVSSVSPGLVETEIFDVNGYEGSRNVLTTEAPRIESKDIADAVLYVLGTPPNIQVTELTIKPVGESV